MDLSRSCCGCSYARMHHGSCILKLDYALHVSMRPSRCDASLPWLPVGPLSVRTVFLAEFIAEHILGPGLDPAQVLGLAPEGRMKVLCASTVTWSVPVLSWFWDRVVWV